MSFILRYFLLLIKIIYTKKFCPDFILYESLHKLVSQTQHVIKQIFISRIVQLLKSILCIL